MDKGPKPTNTPSPNMPNGTYAVVSLNGTADWSFDDADEYMKEKLLQLENISRIYNTMHMTNYAIAAIFSFLSLVVMATMRNSKLRETPIMWYMYHLIGLTVVLIVLHTFAIFGDLQENEGTCLFVIYGLEYLFLAFAVNCILVNTEIFFTAILPLEPWRTRHFLRFMVTTLSGWIAVCVGVGHLIIDNNDARRDGSHCYYSKSSVIQILRFVLRGAIPGCIGFLYTCASIALYVLKRRRSVNVNSSEMIKEITVGEGTAEVNWIRAAACLNSLVIIRVVAWAIMKRAHLFIDIRKNIYAVVVLISVHVQAISLLPLVLLCIPEVRQEIKRMCMGLLRFITRGRIGSQEDTETLAVSFGNINATE